MIILQKNTEGILIGRDFEVPIAIVTISWSGNLDTVLINEIATTDEVELLRKIAYKSAKMIYQSEDDNHMRSHLLSKAQDIFQQCFAEYHANPEKDLTDVFYFNKGRGSFIKNAYDSPQKAVNEIIRKVKEVSGSSTPIKIRMHQDAMERTFYAVSLPKSSGKEFTFWNAHDWPSEEREEWEHNLHIVPNYHPSSPSQGKRSRGMSINGDTNALITSNSICSIYAPPESRQKEKNFGTTWSYMKHPYKATGKSFQFTLRGAYHATKELVDDAVKLILSALSQHPEGNYVGVIGGFNAPYDFPENIANRTGKQLPGNERPRGSEKHCMWTYDVLKQEGELEKAYIPKWFTKENWVEFFKDEKPSLEEV